MSANDTTYQIILDSNGIKAWTMPEGYYPDVEIHCWGAGGGAGWIGAPGGGGGYAKATVNINPGDEVTLQIGQPGRNAPSATGAGGAGGLDTTYRIFRGGNGGARGTWCGQNGGPYPSGGGGGASFVAVNGSVICVAAGGGGGGGYGHDNFKDPGKPGGINSGLTNNNRGGDASYGGGGGGGYLGGASGFASGHTVTGGSGGTNYGNVTAAGSGTLPGGRTTAYYPGDKKGEAGYPGYILLILRKKFNAFIKNPDTSGDWVRANTAYVKTPSQSVTVSQAVGPQTTTYNSVGTNTFTVPAGVTSIQLTVIGGGGGGGGADAQPGSAGRAGARVSGTLAVTPGQILTVSVGSGGGGGSSVAGSAPGGPGGTNSLGYSGGSGSAAGGSGSSGGGGGGGAASAVLVNGSPTVVAAGGGGGGGGGLDSGGQGVSPGGTSGGIAGSAGQTKSGDGGGAGGGGGGYPQGGRGGNVQGGDNGGFSGADGQSLVPAGFSLGEGGAGGIEAIRKTRSSTGGGGGSVTISYTPAPVNVTIVTGGWKQIQQAFTKVNGLWKPLLTNEPIELYNYPVKRISANISIVADTDDYNLLNSLPVTYFEGLMDIDVWVYPNVVITGNTTSTAFTVSGFTEGDRVTLRNYGYLAGRGGQGGNRGYRYTSGKNTYTASPSAGGSGGTGLLIANPITLINNGNIAGGGGGGGGGSVASTGSSKSPSFVNGGQGGGGAGYGPGFNNGTLTSGGAGQDVSGSGDGGNGGSRGQAGTAGGANGAAAGHAGFAIQGVLNLVEGSNVGAFFGPLGS